MNERGAVFRQSQNDFPCSVELGKNKPSFRINRWNNQSLRFIPFDDEDFMLRGDKRRLLYKGRRRSHRFTILNDGEFEYDCILLREPESNVITLRMEGADQYDFFRQPDFVHDDFLKGSYAVYKKDTFIGEGTGKLCHIHRPLIIDALGRKVWGELAIVGNELRITIPEWWLASAKYPVTVDPTVGTTTVGSLSYPVESPDKGSSLVYEIAVNKFLAQEKITGQCTAWAYFSHINTNNHNYHPRIYDDNNNKPSTRRSCNEGLAFWGLWLSDNYIVQQTQNPPQWKSTTFSIIGSINQGSYIWFGGYGDVFYPRFDYGSILYKAYQEYIYADDDDEEGVEYLDFPYFGYEKTYDRKISWYFEYTSQSVNYVRTLTQGINSTDTRTLKAEYKRNLTQTTKLTDERKLKADYKRETSENINLSANVNTLFTFFRHCLETVSNTINISRLPVFNRFINNNISVNETVKDSRDIYRNCDDVINNSDISNRSQGYIKMITENILSNDNFYFPVLFVRNVQDTQTVTDTFQQIRDFIRFIYEEAANIAETERSGDFYRTESDTANADGSVFRHLFIFIKLVSTCFVRDFLLRRFLIAREELILKSKITVELTLESKIN